MAVDTIAHVQKAVFAGLRSAPQLCAFLSSTYSTLTVTLAAYDSDERRVLQWGELLAHLLNHRNPYATVELLPGPSVSNWPLTREAVRSELLAGDAPTFTFSTLCYCSAHLKDVGGHCALSVGMQPSAVSCQLRGHKKYRGELLLSFSAAVCALVKKK